VAHIGQEGALGAVGLLGRLFGLLQLVFDPLLRTDVAND